MTWEDELAAAHRSLEPARRSLPPYPEWAGHLAAVLRGAGYTQVPIHSREVDKRVSLVRGVVVTYRYQQIGSAWVVAAPLVDRPFADNGQPEMRQICLSESTMFSVSFDGDRRRRDAHVPMAQGQVYRRVGRPAEGAWIGVESGGYGPASAAAFVVASIERGRRLSVSPNGLITARWSERY